MCPLSNIPYDSLAKVLNVVKPPQKPVTKSNRISAERVSFDASPTNKPINNEPTMFTVKVAHGKEAATIQRETR